VSTYPTDCPVAATLDAFGDRWTLLIVRDLLRGLSRFADLQRSLGPIAPNLLAGRLRRLEEDGIVTREVYSHHPLRAGYRLTERGHALAPVVITLGRFGIDQLGRPEPDYLAAHVGCGGRVPPVAWRCQRCGEDVSAGELELLPPAAFGTIDPVPANPRTSP
jgi:DNA-binding HxlR family transcriptional regulator